MWQRENTCHQFQGGEAADSLVFEPVVVRSRLRWVPLANISGLPSKHACAEKRRQQGDFARDFARIMLLSCTVLGTASVGIFGINIRVIYRNLLYMGVLVENSAMNGSAHGNNQMSWL